RTEQALRKSETRLKQLIASTLDAVVSVDRDGFVIEWNPQAEAIFGIRGRDIIGRPLPREAIGPRLAEVFDRRAELLRQRVETAGRRADGSELEVEITIEPVGSGAEQTFTAFIRDISERKRAQLELEKREQRFKALVERSWSGVALIDA